MRRAELLKSYVLVRIFIFGFVKAKKLPVLTRAGGERFLGVRERRRSVRRGLAGAEPASEQDRG